ncbi:MAG: aminotransferase class I/II-fold pyridoxal phosphate-dependent enzyme [Chloroflexota bacterium]
MAEISQTKAKAIQRHAINELLQAPTLVPLRRSDQDWSVDQPTIVPDSTILMASVQALEEGQTHYVGVPGIEPLRAALALHLNLPGYNESNMLVTTGVQESRFLTIQKIGEEYGRIGLPAVVHPGVRQAIGTRPLGMELLAVEPSTQLPTLASVRAALESGCKLIYLESPSRLTGATFDQETVATIAKLLIEFDAGAIWDQGLAPWATDYASLAAQPGMAERVAVIGEAWPGIGLESWAIGYIGANANWFPSMQSQKQIMAICTSTATQYAALKAAEQYDAVHGEQVEQLAQLRQETVAKVEAAGAEVLHGETATLLALRDSADSVANGLTASGASYADGADFGAAGVLRLTMMPEQVISFVG